MGSDGKDDRDDQRTMFAPPNPDALNAPPPGQLPYGQGGAFPAPQGGPPPAPPPPQPQTMMSSGNMMGPFPGTMMMPAVGEPGSPFGPPAGRPPTPFAAAGAAAQPPQQGMPMPGGGSPANPHAGTMIMEVPQPPPGGATPFGGGAPAQPVNPFATQIGNLQGPQFGTPAPGGPGGPTHRMSGTMYGPAPVPDMPDSEPGGSPRTMIGQPMMFAEPMIISARLSSAEGPPSTQSDPRPAMQQAVRYPAQPQKRSVLPFVIIGLLVLAGAGVGVAFALGAFKSGEEAGTEPSTIPIPSAKATATESGAATDEPSASHAPSSSASAEETAAPLEDNEAFLTVKSSDKDADVVVNDKTVGLTNQKNRIKCGAAVIRLRGADGTWKSGARQVKTECKKNNVITIEPAGGAPAPTSSPKKPPPPPSTAKPTAAPSATPAPPPPPPKGSSSPKPPPAGPSKGKKKE